MGQGRLDGKVALVTGGASGIGKATVHRMADEGAKVCVVDVHEGGKEIADEIRGTFVHADVRELSQLEDAVAACERELGGLDVAHLNAGIVVGEGNPTEITEDDYRRIMGVNLDGVFFGIKAAVPALRRRGGGALVATASIAGLFPFPPDPLYTATKHAVVGLVRSMSQTIGGDGIRLNCICPGVVDTPLVSPEVRPMLLDMGLRLISPHDIAGTVIELATGSMNGEAWVCQQGKDGYFALPQEFALPAGFAEMT